MKSKSWKTTAAGVGAILIAIGQALSASGEGKDLLSALVSAAPAVIAGLGLLAARDNDKTSEDVRADEKSFQRITQD